MATTHKLVCEELIKHDIPIFPKSSEAAIAWDVMSFEGVSATADALIQEYQLHSARERPVGQQCYAAIGHIDEATVYYKTVVC